VKVQGTLEKDGEVVESKTWYEEDPFWQMLNQSQGQSARISANVGRSIEYGDVKASFVVTVDCPQNTPAMDQAAELAFGRALKYTNDAMQVLAPEIPSIPYEPK
jgi:hypothetical protein